MHGCQTSEWTHTVSVPDGHRRFQSRLERFVASVRYGLRRLSVFVFSLRDSRRMEKQASIGVYREGRTRFHQNPQRDDSHIFELHNELCLQTT